MKKRAARPRRKLPSVQQPTAAGLIAIPGDLEDDIGPVAAQRAREQPVALDAADLDHRTERTPIGLADPEHHGADEIEGVIEHQPLDLAITSAAPVRAREKSPADFDLADVGLVLAIA